MNQAPARCKIWTPLIPATYTGNCLRCFKDYAWHYPDEEIGVRQPIKNSPQNDCELKLELEPA